MEHPVVIVRLLNLKMEMLSFNFELRVKCRKQSYCCETSQNLNVIQTVEDRTKR